MHVGLVEPELFTALETITGVGASVLGGEQVLNWNNKFIFIPVHYIFHRPFYSQANLETTRTSKSQFHPMFLQQACLQRQRYMRVSTTRAQSTQEAQRGAGEKEVCTTMPSYTLLLP